MDEHVTNDEHTDKKRLPFNWRILAYPLLIFAVFAWAEFRRHPPVVGYWNLASAQGIKHEVRFRQVPKTVMTRAPAKHTKFLLRGQTELAGIYELKGKRLVGFEPQEIVGFTWEWKNGQWALVGESGETTKYAGAVMTKMKRQPETEG